MSFGFIVFHVLFENNLIEHAANITTMFMLLFHEISFHLFLISGQEEWPRNASPGRDGVGASQSRGVGAQ